MMHEQGVQQGYDLLDEGLDAELLDALMLVIAERAKQTAQYGEQDHHPLTWLAILGEEVGEAHQAALEAVVALHNQDRPRARELHALLEYELVQVAAVAVAAVERLRRGRFGSAHGEAWSAPLVKARRSAEVSA